jgi:hypothetical protein
MRVNKHERVVGVCVYLLACISWMHVHAACMCIRRSYAHKIVSLLQGCLRLYMHAMEQR